MDKYSGCNVVESVVTRRVTQKTVVKRSHRALFARFCVAAAAIGVICFLAFAPIAGLKSARDALKRAVCYDVFGRDDLGASPVIERLIGE